MRPNAIAYVREWNDGGDDIPECYGETLDFQRDVRSVCDAAEKLAVTQSAIRDFLTAVDRGYLGAMPDGFNQSAFVTSLRAQVAQ